MQEKKQIPLLIGIDDTDNAESRGTGYHARQLAHLIEKNGLGEIHGITRHQLFVDPAIPYTSKNSSACIQLHCNNIQDLIHLCGTFLKVTSAPGSDAGLCVCPEDGLGNGILNWGLRACDTILNMQDAFWLAEHENIYLEGFTGTHGGVIGALAAVGLFANGNDGRYIWLKGARELRDLAAGCFKVEQLMHELDIDEIRTLKGEYPAKTDMIFAHDWIRPVRMDHKAVLITQKTKNKEEYEWELTAKEIIRDIS